MRWHYQTCWIWVSRCFGGTYFLHLRGRKVSQATYQHEAGGKHSRRMEAAHTSETSADYTALNPVFRRMGEWRYSSTSLDLDTRWEWGARRLGSFVPEEIAALPNGRPCCMQSGLVLSWPVGTEWRLLFGLGRCPGRRAPWPRQLNTNAMQPDKLNEGEKTEIYVPCL
jgi:hypothetical protein